MAEQLRRTGRSGRAGAGADNRSSLQRESDEPVLSREGAARCCGGTTQLDEREEMLALGTGDGLECVGRSGVGINRRGLQAADTGETRGVFDRAAMQLRALRMRAARRGFVCARASG
jgi:hypothetical protein